MATTQGDWREEMSEEDRKKVLQHVLKKLRMYYPTISSEVGEGIARWALSDLGNFLSFGLHPF